jgi:hypothetical protein
VAAHRDHSCRWRVVLERFFAARSIASPRPLRGTTGGRRSPSWYLALQMADSIVHPHHEAVLSCCDDVEIAVAIDVGGDDSPEANVVAGAGNPLEFQDVSWDDD